MEYFGKDTVGLVILVETGTPLAGATDIVLNITKPDGSEVEWTGTIQGTTQIKYTTEDGDLNLAGWYRIYPTCTLGTWVGPGKPNRFLIEDPERPDENYGI